MSDIILYLMVYSKMFIGDSQTMTNEAAILGTPAIKCNSFAGRLSIPNELEYKYGLCYSFLPHNFNSMINKIKELLIIPDLKEQWHTKRNTLLNDKIDTTSFLVWLVENHSASVNEILANPRFDFSQFK